jgi:cell division protein FtsB
MVARTRLSRFLRIIGLYCIAAALLGYFAFHSQHGNYGSDASAALKQEIERLSSEHGTLKQERIALERRNLLLRADRIDPDLLEELARANLAFAMPNDLIMAVSPR